ncbi:MAG: hypothetical protein GY729_19000 [Desulfobacteraceae bacterium]|nr:hypothetical protein [Desulfobacteraceae bacterium]
MTQQDASKNNKDDLDISLLIDMASHKAVYEEVKGIIKSISPDFDFTVLDQMYLDIVALFEGRFQGYQKCNTLYHNLQHTTDCFIAQTRLLHGAVLNGHSFNDEEILLVLCSAFMHDTGYIQTTEDKSGTGAKYTNTHIQRSIDFMKGYCKKRKVLLNHVQDMADILNCTGINLKLKTIQFSSPKIEFIGKMLGSADLVGQMADRTYLEKLVFLFYEFVEANIQEYKSEYDFLYQTSDFYRSTEDRLVNELDDIWQYMKDHFKAYYDIDQDLYKAAIKGNLMHLENTLHFHKQNFKIRLRRAGLPEYVKNDLIKSSF